MSNHSSQFEKGTVLAARFEILDLIGTGGMSRVYRANDRSSNSAVVIKVPLPHLLNDREFLIRFQREMRALVELKHPNIVAILDIGSVHGIPFAVLPFFPGGDLNDTRIKVPDGSYKPVRPNSLKTWLPGVSDALDYIHRRRLIHRDIKPANILFDADRNPYVADFGIAKILADSTFARDDFSRTKTGMVLGTPDYLPPEIIMGQKYDGRADLFALAVTVYELLAGRLPFAEDTAAAVLVKQTTTAIPLLPGNFWNCSVASACDRSCLV